MNKFHPAASLSSVSIYSIVFLHLVFDTSASVIKAPSDELLCRQCGYTIVRNSATIMENGGASTKQSLLDWRMPILNKDSVLIQTFDNPNKQRFSLLSVRHSDCAHEGEAFNEHSWYPEYSWRVNVCPRCSTHLGWNFKRETLNKQTGIVRRDTFDGLVVDNIISDAYADTLTSVQH